MFIESGFLPVGLVCMLFAQHILLPCSHNTFIFLWGAHSSPLSAIMSFGMSSPHPLIPNSRHAPQAWPMRRQHQLSDWLWGPNESQPRNLCRGLLRKGQRPPCWAALLVECKPGAYHHEGRACLRREGPEQSSGRESESHS